MKLKKHQIIPIGALVILLLVCGLGWQFYLKGLLEEYEANSQELSSIKSKIQSLESTFQGTSGRPVLPEQAVEQWEEAVPAWRLSLQRSAAEFTLADMLETETVSEEEGVIPKFHYTETLPAMKADLEQYMRDQSQNGVQFGQMFTFGVPSASQINQAQYAVSAEDVNRWLRRYSFGRRMVEMLVDAGARGIYTVEVWQPYVVDELLEKRTVGLAFEMPMADLIEFLDGFYDEDRYFTIDSIQIRTNSLVYASPRGLQVQMLLTQAAFLEENAQAGRGGAAPGGGNGQGAGSGATPAANPFSLPNISPPRPGAE